MEERNSSHAVCAKVKKFIIPKLKKTPNCIRSVITKLSNELSKSLAKSVWEQQDQTQ